MTLEAERPVELADLVKRYPRWEIGEQWTIVATGPDVRTCWARRGSVTLKARDPVGLGGQLWVADRMAAG